MLAPSPRILGGMISDEEAAKICQKLDEGWRSRLTPVVHSVRLEQGLHPIHNGDRGTRRSSCARGGRGRGISRSLRTRGRNAWSSSDDRRIISAQKGLH